MRIAPWARAAFVLGITATTIAACGDAAGAPTPAPTPRATPGPPKACAVGAVPESGFILDTRHSGPLTVGRYSPSADIQAALVYFGFQQGVRNALTDLGDASPQARPAAPHDVVVVCDALRFAGADSARQFVRSFAQLRIDNGQKELPAPHLGDAATLFHESDQSFAGYPVQHVSAVELAAARGAEFYSVGVYGAAPQDATAVAVLNAMLAGGGS